MESIRKEGMDKHADADRQLVISVTGAITKSIFYICLTVTAGMLMSNCNLKEATITQCEQSCDDFGSRMESVTRSKCVCMQDAPTTDDIWVLPR
jgi:hypothetical protein